MKSASEVGSSVAVATFGTSTPTVAEKGREVLAESLGRSEDLLEKRVRGREAVQETQWLRRDRRSRCEPCRLGTENNLRRLGQSASLH
jgi:hypothetical protein